MGCTVCNFVWTKDMKDGELLARYSRDEMTKEGEREIQNELSYDIAYSHAWMIRRSIKYWFKIRWRKLWHR
jgi:hypothetical protein